MDDPAKPSQRLVWSPDSSSDISRIYQATAYDWGVRQADRYLRMLQDNAEYLSKFPLQGRPLAALPHLRAYFVKCRRARWGHYIVFRQIDGGIYIERVLHSGMDLEFRLSKDKG